MRDIPEYTDEQKIIVEKFLNNLDLKRTWRGPKLAIANFLLNFYTSLTLGVMSFICIDNSWYASCLFLACLFFDFLAKKKRVPGRYNHGLVLDFIKDHPSEKYIYDNKLYPAFIFYFLYFIFCILYLNNNIILIYIIIVNLGDLYFFRGEFSIIKNITKQSFYGCKKEFNLYFNIKLFKNTGFTYLNFDDTIIGVPFILLNYLLLYIITVSSANYSIEKNGELYFFYIFCSIFFHGFIILILMAMSVHQRLQKIENEFNKFERKENE